MPLDQGVLSETRPDTDVQSVSRNRFSAMSLGLALAGKIRGPRWLLAALKCSLMAGKWVSVEYLPALQEKFADELFAMRKVLHRQTGVGLMLVLQ